MSGADSRSNRRQFFRGAVGAGTLAGLGLNLQPARAAAAKLKIQGRARCPASAPTARSAAARSSASATARSSTSRATRTARSTAAPSAPRARPRSSSPSIPNRLTKVKYRAPHATEWEEKDARLGDGPDRPAGQGDARRRLSRETWDGQGRRRQARQEAGQPLRHHRLARRGDDGQRVELRPAEAAGGHSG